MTTSSVCAGCGTVLPPSKGRGAPRKWCSERCRKRTLYGGVCIDCGAPTQGLASGYAKESRRCRPCAKKAAKYWTRERIIDAIQEWVRLHDEPPGAMEWSPAQARAAGLVWMADRFYEGRWPWIETVQSEFGSWNDAIRAAGFEPRRRGERGAAWYRPEDVAA